MGIGCEACHGPGSLHAEKPSENKLVKLTELDAKRQVDVCGQCHIRGENVNGREDALGFLPGDDLSKIFNPVVPDEKNLAKGDKSDFHPDKASKKHHQQYKDFVQSKHYNAGVSCFTCHNPHSNNITGQLKDTPEKLCFSCHNEGGKAATKLDKPLDINKYMPKRAKSATKGDITTHSWIPEQTYLIKK